MPNAPLHHDLPLRAHGSSATSVRSPPPRALSVRTLDVRRAQKRERSRRWPPLPAGPAFGSYTALPLLWPPPSLVPLLPASQERDPHHQKGSKSRRCGMTSVPNRRMERKRSSSAKSPKLNSPKNVLNIPAVAHALSFLTMVAGEPRRI